MRSHRRVHPTTDKQSTPGRTAALVSAVAVTGLLAAGSSTAGGRPAPPAGPVPAAAESIAVHQHDDQDSGGPMPVPARVVAYRPHPAPPPPTAAATPPPPDPAASPAPRGAGSTIPEQVLAAYRNAELTLRTSHPECGLTWNLLAGIGRIESGHARSGDLDARGTTNSPIRGPALDGTLPGNEMIRAASGYVRAVGPMQFLPDTWQRWGADGNGDGIADPDNIYDAALAAGRYLCADGTDLRDPDQRLRAILRYNHSAAYASTVLTWSRIYAGDDVDPADLTPVPPDLGSAPDDGDERARGAETPVSPDVDPAPDTPAPAPAPAPAPMIHIPGLPPIPCGILCPPPA
ncbi:lytic transglycosylase domain-containing protein [Nocardia sp. NPDC052254]|uniref:lytic transglycosylase domain-containing protein n=1 Tax=Nocardia sp. NPDC052254 TaxID=3155681 RepID=UPI003422731A